MFLVDNKKIFKVEYFTQHCSIRVWKKIPIIYSLNIQRHISVLVTIASAAKKSFKSPFIKREKFNKTALIFHKSFWLNMKAVALKTLQQPIKLNYSGWSWKISGCICEQPENCFHIIQARLVNSPFFSRVTAPNPFLFCWHIIYLKIIPGLDAANKIRSNARRWSLRVSSDKISAHINLFNIERRR